MGAAHPHQPVIFMNVETGEKVRYEGKRAPLVPVSKAELSPIKFCCHLCNYKGSTQNDLAAHLRNDHFNEDDIDDIEGEELDGVILEDELECEEEEDEDGDGDDPKIKALPVVSMLNLESLSNDEFQEMLNENNLSGISW